MGKTILRKANVLAVDDKPANLLVLEALLSHEHNVIQARSGREAMAILTTRQDIDVILLDVQMPELDGYETAKQIRQMHGCEDIPIIFVTAIYTDDPFVKKGYQSGGIDYFSKPFDPDILRMKVSIYASYHLKSELLKERELHIRESEELLRVGRKLSSVLESLPVGVMIADADGRICQITEEVSRILRSAEPLESDSYGEILNWWSAEGQAIKNQEGPLWRAVNAGETTHSEKLRVRCFDGTVQTVLVSASPLRKLDGRVVGAVILIQDLTEREKIEQELSQRVTKLIALGVELEESSSPPA